MSRNPFEQFVTKKELDWEEVEGTFSCDECHKRVGDAKYNAEKEILTWKCPDGHTNRIKWRF